MNHIEELAYWINERSRIHYVKEQGYPKPWSDDPIFQVTYFTNIHREWDKTTKFIRAKYASYRPEDDMFEFNIVISRLVNRIESLALMPYYHSYDPEQIISDWLAIQAENGKFWGGAYLVSTNGATMPKITYIVENVLGPFMNTREPLCRGYPTPSLASAYTALRGCNGLGSFMSAQILADLKNTLGHPLSHASDFQTWAAPGPGSIRGLAWALGYQTPQSRFLEHLGNLKAIVEARIPKMDAQDFQNCLCEFDKYMRIKEGTGRSKRKYDGA
jgi:hypothetical protein